MTVSEWTAAGEVKYRVPLDRVIEGANAGEFASSTVVNWIRRNGIPAGLPDSFAGINARKLDSGYIQILNWQTPAAIIGAFNPDIDAVVHSVSIGGVVERLQAPLGQVQDAIREHPTWGKQDWDTWFLQVRAAAQGETKYLIMDRGATSFRYIADENHALDRLAARGPNHPLSAGDFRELTSAAEAEIWFNDMQSGMLDLTAGVGDGVILVLEMAPGGGIASVIARSANGQDLTWMSGVDVGLDVIQIDEVGKAIKLVPKAGASVAAFTDRLTTYFKAAGRMAVDLAESAISGISGWERIAAKAPETTDALIELMNFWTNYAVNSRIKIEQAGFDRILAEITNGVSGPNRAELEALFRNATDIVPSVDLPIGAIALTKSSERAIKIGPGGGLGTLMEELGHFHDMRVMSQMIGPRTYEARELLDSILRASGTMSAKARAEFNHRIIEASRCLRRWNWGDAEIPLVRGATAESVKDTIETLAAIRNKLYFTLGTP